jgi:hypothetical protein
MTSPLPEIHVHVHVEGSGSTDPEIKEILVATKEEVLASLAELKTLAVENQEDTTRIIEKLDQAVQDQDLTAVADAVNELRSITQATNDAIEAADPETPTTPEEPTEPETPEGPVVP